MIAHASGLGIGVGRISRQLRGVGVLAMPDAELDTTWCVWTACEVPPETDVLRLHVPSVAVGRYIDSRCVVDRVEVTGSVISAT